MSKLNKVIIRSSDQQEAVAGQLEVGGCVGYPEGSCVLLTVVVPGQPEFECSLDEARVDELIGELNRMRASWIRQDRGRTRWLRIVQYNTVCASKLVDKEHPGEILAEDRDWADGRVKKLDAVETGYYDLELLDENRDVIDHTIEIK